MRKGAYVWLCYGCEGKIRGAWRAGWFEEDPDKRWEPFHWNDCLDEYATANIGLTVSSRGMPSFRLSMPFISWTIELGTE